MMNTVQTFPTAFALFALNDTCANIFDCAGLSAYCFSLVLKYIIYKDFISDSSTADILTQQPNEYKSTFSEAPPTNNTNNNACISNPSFSTSCSVIGWNTSTISDWNSVVWFVPSHFFVSC